MKGQEVNFDPLNAIELDTTDDLVKQLFSWYLTGRKVSHYETEFFTSLVARLSSRCAGSVIRRYSWKKVN